MLFKRVFCNMSFTIERLQDPKYVEMLVIEMFLKILFQLLANLITSLIEIVINLQILG